MGFMDKMKSQATALAEKAQEGAKAGGERLSQMQGKRQSDALLLELGGIVYLERVGRGDAASDARAEEIVASLQTHEAENGPVTVTAAVPPAGASGAYVPDGAGTVSAAGGDVPASGGIPASSGGIPTSSPDGGIPASSGGIPTSSPDGGIPASSSLPGAPEHGA